MRIYWLEMKRVLKSRRALTLLLIALVMSSGMAWLPVMFESINYQDENGNIVELNGLEAIAYKKSIRSVHNGEVTPEKLKAALKTYQRTVSQYGEVGSENFPLAVYTEKISPIRPLLGRQVQEAFADHKTGMAADLKDISPDQLDRFYEQTVQHLKDFMQLEQKGSAAQEQALRKYAEVKTPFLLYAGYSRDAFDYIGFFIFVCVILCTAMAAPTFSNEYQTGSDSVLRCTKHGRSRLAITKIAAALTIFVVNFVVCIFLHLLISNLAFGPECMKTSMQMLFSAISLPALNLGQLQVVMAIGGLLSLLATISFTLFLSAKCKDSLTVILIAFASCLLPIFAYSTLGENWISSILPSAGVGMKNSLLYQLIDLNYLHVGQISLWTPYVIMAAAAVEIPVFLFLAVRAYCKHQVA
jgi:ABC-type transport system involved in multi-copper enzyme maturation permease subunit